MSEEDKQLISERFNVYFPGTTLTQNRLGFGGYVNFSRTHRDAFIPTATLSDGTLAVGLIMPVAGKATNRLLGSRTMVGPWILEDWIILSTSEKRIALDRPLTSCRDMLDHERQYEILYEGRTKALGRKLTQEERYAIRRDSLQVETTDDLGLQH